MRSRELHDALRRLTADVGALLTSRLEEGAELPFDVAEEGNSRHEPVRARRGPVLYCYRPLTGAFIAEQWGEVRSLDSYGRAVGALGSGAAAYLRHRGLSGSNPDEALRDLMGRLFEDATTFSLPEERFQRVHAELDAMLEGSTVTATVVAPLHGVRISGARVDIGDGLALARRSAVASPPEALEGSLRAAESTAAGDEHEPMPREPNPLDVFCVLERDLAVDSPLPVDDARVRFRRVLTSLRLCGAGGTALGPLAWARAGGGAWHPVALGVSARSRPESWELRHSEEQELRELLEILSLSRHSQGVGWALGRFEMGCDRVLETEALSDYLLALCTLLGDEEGGSERTVAARLAALCAPEEDRLAVEEQLLRAFSLERGLAHGHATAGSALALDSPRGLVRDVEGYLRALLRDLLCGYLDEDLRGAADEMLHGAAPPEGLGEISVRDIRPPSEEDTAELEALDLEPAAVTPSVDWDSG